MRDNPMIANRLLLGLVLLVYSASEVLAKDWVATDICYSDDLGNNLCYDPVSLTPFEYIQLQSVGSETVVNYDVSPSQMGIDYMNYVYGTDNVTHARHLFGISKRASDWRDCTINSGNLQRAACEVSHGIGPHIGDLAVPTLVSLIDEFISNAFTQGRATKNPRDICYKYNKDQICVSWSTSSSSRMHSTTYYDVKMFAANCIKQAYSAAMRVELCSGVSQTICVSDRAKGCSDSPQSCFEQIEIEELL